MRLQSKLTLFSAASKVVILLLLILGLPPLIHRVALLNTDQRLLQKEGQVVDLIAAQGIESFIAEDEDGTYGSYNLLKEEFISLEKVAPNLVSDTIENSLRKVEGEIVEYRVRSRTYDVNGQRYLLEIGRSLATIRESSQTLQRYAFYFLLAVVALTVFVDLAFSKILLRPLELIIRRLQRVEHPSTFKAGKLRTSTDDFIYLNDTINGMMGQIQAAFLKEKEFIGNVSHELLTPISILQNRMENLLTDPGLPAPYLEKIVENQKTLHRLKNIIQALLLISRIENEQFLKNETVDLENLASDVVEEIRERAEARDITLETRLAQNWVLGKANYSLLYTMLFNVVNNAIKYNKPGGKISVEGSMVNKAYELCVRDTGVGMAAHQIPHIFSRFKRLQAADGESHGLGLPIVQTVAQFHKIKLSVDSAPGEGTTFCFRFSKN
ncbi:MAG: sensor histidine kinase [Adhaeribacter sp.]